jgi:ribosomal protein L11 methyltransferase
VVSVLLSCDIDEKDGLIAELYAFGTTGIVEQEELGGACTLDAFFDTRDEALAAVDAFPQHRPQLREHGMKDYVAEFQQHWQPVLVGERIWLAPPWHPGPVPEGRVRVDYQPYMACGSGAHPCTQLCLAALERLLQPGDAVLDVGAGSGILLLAARTFGASRVAGCDIDQDSVEAEQQAELPVFTGSADAVRDASFDVVIANISSLVAEQLLPDLLRVSRRAVIVSGFREDEMPLGVTGGEVTKLDGWAAITLCHPPSSCQS